ncbi:Asparagine synthetase [glutamine-hydrolyzing] 3 [Streptomyces sp. RB5]|uniref:asparagine synthase (glutamine-hydrolyzing) n=1 Tax=Streptomyces smaragdinus TaxID=2585196 RepID=A0A7K0CDT8_9ACTN|nr:asparagine synthase (glutamine-hydrolyzing) [Streptomyces smaragdinus]MQY11610.1 Asparagine synthetase [glutamine-hydrolyzing] 3 [Streptomyces smaragdinus]
MCGIAGWVDFRSDLSGEERTMRTMTAALAPRGVDDQGLWLSPHAALGHTRTAIIDVVDGVQPFVAEEDGRAVAVIVYNGEVYNFKQLRTELTGRGHRFRTRSDTEVVLHAYLEWGADCAERLEGIFAFGVWDLRRRELVLVRDRLGVKPLFYHRTPHGVVFASEPKALLAGGLVRPVVDTDGLREMFAVAKKPGQAVFRDMRELLPGHTLTIGDSGAADRTYWRLEARPHEDDLPQTIRHTRGLLEDIVLRELEADVPLCTALSGGVDSSSVTAIAAMWRWKLAGERVRTFVTTFDEYAENFRPDDVRFSPDEPYAVEVAEHLRSDHVNIRLSPQDLMDPVTRRAVLAAQDAPTTLGDMDTSNYLTAREIKTHSTVALVGEVADEIFGGYNWMFNPDTVRAEAFPWVAHEALQPSSLRGQGRGLFDQGLLDKIDMHGYYHDAYHEAAALAPHQEGEDDTERRMRTIGYLTLTHWLPMLLDRGDRLSMAHGLELRVPYSDHRLVEYLYNTPWSFKTFDGREKAVLRHAVDDLVPRSVLERKKSPWPVTQDPAYLRMLHRELAALAADPQAPIRPYLDPKACEEMLADPGAANDWPRRMHIETALQFNSWLSLYGIELAV